MANNSIPPHPGGVTVFDLAGCSPAGLHKKNSRSRRRISACVGCFAFARVLQVKKAAGASVCSNCSNMFQSFGTLFQLSKKIGTSKNLEKSILFDVFCSNVPMFQSFLKSFILYIYFFYYIYFFLFYHLKIEKDWNIGTNGVKKR